MRVGANKVAGAAIASVVGGVGAQVGGGSFANGAVTGAFGYLFNNQAEELMKNRENGKIAELSRADQLTKLGVSFEKQVAISLIHDGKVVTAVVDFVYWSEGKLVFEEIKYGEHAKLSNQQKLIYGEIIKSGNVSIVAADRAALLGVKHGQLLSAQSLKLSASLAASATGRAASQWGRLGLAAATSSAFLALDFALTIGNAHAPTMPPIPNPTWASFTPAK
jgi:hypothetical protein